jgi:recombination protein RecT
MSQELATITTKIKELEPRMLQVLDPVTAKRELSFAVQHVANSNQLQECTQNSILTAIYNIANIGLSLNPASKEAYLVPRYNSNTRQKEASLQPSYVGLVKLLTDAGTVTQVVCNIVYEGDKIEIESASGFVKHNPCLIKSNRGQAIGCYAKATLASGATQVEWIDKEEIEKIRACSESWKNEKTRPYSPWFTQEGEMWRKTVIRRLYKYLPRSGRNLEKLDEAIRVDDAQYNASGNQLGYIEDLLRTANISDEVSRRINSEFMSYSQAEAETCIEYLKANQAESNDPRKQFDARMKNL